ncbi:hypothetical protein H6A66_12040 [Bacteroides caecigallinarum]|uniref:hypothetical protein n=1 Tax=Bacteroides caecigallinarum TaxID=1411144 RepID=UPI0019590B49|nr:hypothetical protein [Bacteroides caecigallinarum]MBM6865896.1 hypothetical protein [Bacteroides caecigallinarum]
MKIINTESGKPYQLNPGTELSIERTNPFFNDYGEQTLPVSLPDSDYNRTLLGNPGMTQRKDKVKMVDASIQDGNFYSVCRQAILSVTQGESIETSFYMNEGSFYSRLEDVYITDVFGDETVPGVTTVDQAIEWMRQLYLSGGDERFACFPVSAQEDDHKFILNLWDTRSDNFYFASDRDRIPAYKDRLAGKKMAVSKGFYLTPFLKANYVLERMFSYLGYTLQPNFFTETEQFRNMVFLNNIADAIVLGTIKLSQLIPKVTCKSILDLFRKKFCCEYVIDEYAKTASIVLMNDIIDSVKGIDLSPYLVGNIKLSYPDSYQQIILRASGSVDSDNESSLDSLPLIKSQFPTAQFSKEYGCFYRSGYNYVPSTRYRYSVKEIVADSSQAYYEGGILPTLQIDVPECIPSSFMDAPIYIGNVQYLNSSLKLFSSDGSESVDATDIDKSSDDSMYLMLAFVYRINSTTGGTVTNYGADENTFQRIGDYALIYNGDDGIFERFYRKYDTLLRNSLHDVEAKLNLPMSLVRDISAVDKINIDGVDFLINSMKFSVGSKSNLSEANLLTMNLYEPVDRAKILDEIIPPLVSTGYKWEIKSSYQDISEEDYNNSIYKDAEMPAIFPPQPTSEYVGKQNFVRKLAEQYNNLSGKTAWRITTFWLEVVAV